MPRPWVGMVAEPPAEFVAFVAQQLHPLRHEAARLVGDERRADELYPQALVDVAIRWQWFELLRRRLNCRDVADRYLHEALLRRSTRWLSEQDGLVDIEVWSADDRRAMPRPPPHTASPHPAAPEPRSGQPPPGPVRSSTALRLLPMVGSSLREPSPVAEAAIAWLHACREYRRARLVAFGVAVLVALMVMTRIAGV